jgi:CotS family spore coat protein
MNDRALGVLDNYDIEVLRCWKGRGAILCETKTGVKILKEVKGSPKRLQIQKQLLEQISENGYPDVEQIIPTKEGEPFARDEEQAVYCLKDYREGRECNIRDWRECGRMAEYMAGLHQAMRLPELIEKSAVKPFFLPDELEKHNRELKKARRFLKEKGQKTDFELALWGHYDFFYEKARQTLEEIQAREEVFSPDRIRQEGYICHGDLQHHNGLFCEEGMFFINFEKFTADSPVRDIALFFRKMMEKNNWSPELGRYVLASYEKKRHLSPEEKIQLYYRLSYPEKFWKIVNFYYNSGKAWIPDRNRQKLERLWKQEEEKRVFLESILKSELE